MPHFSLLEKRVLFSYEILSIVLPWIKRWPPPSSSPSRPGVASTDAIVVTSPLSQEKQDDVCKSGFYRIDDDDDICPLVKIFVLLKTPSHPIFKKDPACASAVSFLFFGKPKKIPLLLTTTTPGVAADNIIPPKTHNREYTFYSSKIEGSQGTPPRGGRDTGCV